MRARTMLQVRQHRVRPTALGKLVRLGLTLLLLAILAVRMDWHSAATSLRGADARLWVLAAVFYACVQTISAIRWSYFGLRHGFHQPIVKYVRHYFVGMFFNLMLPTSVGGDFVRAWYLGKPEQRIAAAMLTAMLDRISGLMVLVGLACLGTLFGAADAPLAYRLLPWGIAAFGLLGLAAIPLLVPYRAWFGAKVGRLLDALAKTRSPQDWIVPLLLSTVVQLGNVLIVYLLCLALQLSIGFAYLLLAVPMIALLTMLPISINGMGVREGASVILLVPAGVSAEDAVLVALAWFSVTVAVSLLGGIVYALDGQDRVATERTQDLEHHGSLDRHSDQGRTRQSKAAA